MKIAHHTVLALACTLLLLPLAPAAAGHGEVRKSNTPHAKLTGPGPLHASMSPPIRLAQNSADENSRSNNGKRRNNKRNDDKSGDGSADKGTEPPAVSRSDAADIAQRATGGRVLSVRESGRYWQVKVLVDDQRVRFVNVDKYSGRVR